MLQLAPPSSIRVLTDKQTSGSPTDEFRKSSSNISALGEEIPCDELDIEKCSGDENHNPRPEQRVGPTVRLPQDTPHDPNMVSWDGPDDTANPKNWSVRYRWMLTALCCVMTVNVTFASSAPTSAISHIRQDFNVPAEIAYLITSVFLIGYCFGPLFWAPGSELLGRRPIMCTTMTCYMLLNIGEALVTSITGLLIIRFFAGYFAVAPLTICGGILSDIWDPLNRGHAASLFTACVFIGPVIGPIVGGYIVDSSLSWRWVFWVMMMFTGVCVIAAVTILPETYAPVLLQRKARRLRKSDPEKNRDIYAAHERQDRSFRGVVRRTLYRPFEMLLLEPILVLITVYLSLVYGILYGLFEGFPIIFGEKRDFTIAQDGLVFIGVGIGSSLGAIVNLYGISHYPQLIKRWRGFPPPEERLFCSKLGGISLVIGTFWLGWTGQYPSVPWYVPAISAIFIGFSISAVFTSFQSYIVDTYLMYSASALAANTIVRSAVAAAFPLFTPQMFEKLGINWSMTLLGLFSLVLAPSPFLFYTYGVRIRSHSKFAPCVDLRIAKEIAEEEKAALGNV